MNEEQFRQLCNVYGFAPSRALRELIDCAIGQAAAELRRLHDLAMEQQGKIYALEMARSMEQKTAKLKRDALAKPEERNFCPRCGKRALGIHTCTPP